ncbi:patatin-like phospholipase family protein [Paludibaculum fermentans]|uniref:patatin-like phospholipase family protein n=1 Tax=Paludibaculum fermentans TaxID=1473598 RepID=UPI003EB962E0
MRASIFILTVAVLTSASPALPQASPQSTPRPRVGLVLAGGSANGLVHVGVIRWLDEHHIPVDYIAGTSMGALMGALYATGRSPEEITAFVDAIDWPATLRVNTPFQSLSFRRKEDRRQFPTAIEVGLKGGFKLPMGLSPGHGVGLVISRATSPYEQMKSFDLLPIPFRSVATDLVRGQEVIFSSGSLFDALRATMSIPGVFAPLRLGSQVLVDGGVVNNLPVDVVRGMGADVVIAVGLDTSETDGGYDNLLSAVRRSLGIMVSANEKRNMKNLGKADLILLPDLAGFSGSSYSQSTELADRGYEEADRKRRFLQTLAVSEPEWAALQAVRASRRRPEWIQPEFLEVRGMVGIRDERLPDSLSGKLGVPLTQPDLEDQLTQISGLGRYKSADYGFLQRDGRQGIQVRVHPKHYGPPFLNTGVFVSGSNSEGLKLGIAGRLTIMDLLIPNSEWRTDFSLGTDNRAATEYYARLRQSRFFMAPGWFLTQRSQDFYNHGSTSLYSYKVRETGGTFDLGYSAGRFGEVRVGYKVSRLHTYVTSGTSGAQPLSGQARAARVRFAYDRMDHIVPTRGLSFTFDGQWVDRWPGARKQFPILETRIAYARQLSESYSIVESASGGTTVSNGQGWPPFTLGGPNRLAALAHYQLIGNHYYYNGFYVMHSLAKERVSFLKGFRAVVGYETGNAFNAGDPLRPFNDGVAGLIRETPIGVVFLGGSVGERGERKIFISIGRFFY